jgi:hypothetical protein
MEWEIVEQDGKWYIYLKKKFWKFKDQPVCYCVVLTEDAAKRCLDRLNNPLYDEDL